MEANTMSIVNTHLYRSFVCFFFLSHWQCSFLPWIKSVLSASCFQLAFEVQPLNHGCTKRSYARSRADNVCFMLINIPRPLVFILQIKGEFWTSQPGFCEFQARQLPFRHWCGFDIFSSWHLRPLTAFTIIVVDVKGSCFRDVRMSRK